MPTVTLTKHICHFWVSCLIACKALYCEEKFKFYWFEKLLQNPAECRSPSHSHIAYNSIGSWFFSSFRCKLHTRLLVPMLHGEMHQASTSLNAHYGHCRKLCIIQLTYNLTLAQTSTVFFLLITLSFNISIMHSFKKIK